MVSWGSAFKAAILTIFYQVIWLVIGCVACLYGLSLSVTAVQFTDSGLQFQWANAYGGIATFAIGLSIIYLSGLATIYKVLTDLIGHEMRPDRTAVASMRAPTNDPKRSPFAERFITCSGCGATNPVEWKFCGICGARLVKHKSYWP